MSIKKLFDSVDKNLQYADYKTQKEAFEPVESARNAAAIELKQKTYVPAVDYSEPTNFAFYGSAYLYYSGAINRILDFYPYDGSRAEQNEFYNGLYSVEKYIFDKKYPKSTGYVVLSAGGWGATDGSSMSDGYGMPSTQEFITFKGGPGTGSGGSSLISKMPDKHSSRTTYANIYQTDIYSPEGLPSDYGKGSRTSNLKADFDQGVTIEFWFKKTSFDTTKTVKEVIFDMWNNGTMAAATYGRLTIEVDGEAGSASPFKVTAQSGSTPVGIFEQTLGSTPRIASLATWNHYSVVLQNSGSSFVTKLYVNGYLDDTKTTASTTLGEITNNTVHGRIGGLLTGTVAPPTHTPAGRLSASAGSGKLSASMDEFRYWKVARDSRDIVDNWFTQVGGGSNSDVSNATLGVYYKFNEGITATSSIDRVVLDYAGRITNGAWTGYTANSRNTGSAIVSASAASWEKQDPIMQVKHSSVVALKTELFDKGKDYDTTNNSQFINYAPSWVIEKHEEEGNDNLKIMSHIMGAYFDQIHLLTTAMPKLRFVNYTTASGTPVPFASHLPQSLGLYSPEIFIDADVLERFENRTEKKLFESKLNETKNLIYLNLYNNLANIYKAKGTAKAIRNVIRCFNLDDSLLKTNVYAKGTEFPLSNNLTQHSNEHTSLNFNQSGNVGAVVYQAIDPTNAYSKGYISGSLGSVSLANVEDRYGCTVEADVTFPMYFTGKDKFPRTFTTVSLFGAHAVNTGSVQALSGTSLTYTTGAWGGTYDLGNFQVHAVREAIGSKNVYFKLTSSIYPHPLPVLTSSTFYEVYDNSQWNLSVRIKPDTPLAELVTGAIGSYGYKVVFRGTNSILGSVRDSFELTGALNYTTGSYFLRSPKRLYVGAQRTDITGTLVHRSDVKFENLKYWAKHIDNTSLNQHLFDTENAGISGSYKNISTQDSLSDHYDITNANMLALNWNFEQLSTSDAGGNFIVQDISSGSAMMSNTSNFGWIANVAGYQNTGYGNLFPVSNTNIVETKPLNMFKFTDPERVVGTDMINILDKDDEVYGISQTLPDFVYTIEKSRNEVISEQMLTFFAGVLDFNNLIGAPVNRYRSRYKELEYLREVFYRRVSSVSSVERYVEYYKWFDDAISQIVEQMVPASADLIEGVLNTIEPTVLERPKYESKYPTLQSEAPDPEAAMTGESFMNYPARFGSRPAPEVTGSSAVAIGTVNLDYWSKRAERTDPVVGSKRFGLSDAAAAVIDAKREKIRKVVVSNPYLSRSAPTLYDNATSANYTGQQFRILSLGKLQKIEAGSQNSQTPIPSIGGGVNNTNKANIQFVYTALHPHGPIDQSGGRYIPQNILLGFINDLVPEPYDNDPKLPTLKTKRELGVLHGRNAAQGEASTTGQGYYDNLKASYAFPFNIMSSSLTKTEATGYQKEIRDKISASIDLVNLHNDVYGPDGEVPMQGPFTNYAVGGHQSRHVKLNNMSSFAEPSGSIRLMGVQPSNGDKIEISDGDTIKIFTFKNTTSAATDVKIGVSLTLTMNSFAAAVAANLPYISTLVEGTPPEKLTLKNKNPRIDGKYAKGNVAIGPGGGTAWIDRIEGMAGGYGFGLSGRKTRSEAWKIFLGTCDGTMSGAIGMTGPDYPHPTDYDSTNPYPNTSSQKAIYYRDMTAKRPVNIRNIHMTTGSTILGNYRKTYEIVQMAGASSNPRAWIKAHAALDPLTASATWGVKFPANVIQGHASGATVINTYLDMPRMMRAGTVPAWPYNLNTPSSSHFTFVADYSTKYLTGGANSSITVTRFANNGGAEVMNRGHQDFRAAEFSVYNALNFTNLSVRKQSQGSKGTYSETNGIRVGDIHGNDYGLTSHLARHTARFGRDSLAFPHVDAERDAYDLKKPFTGFSEEKQYRGHTQYLQGWWRLNTNIQSSGDATDSSGRNRTGTFDASADRPKYTTSTPSTYIQTSSMNFDAAENDKINIGTAATWDALIGNNLALGSTQQMTICAWIYKIQDGGSNIGNIIHFGDSDIAVYTSTTEAVNFVAAWNSSAIQWATTVTQLFELNQWAHIAITYDANNVNNDPKVYVNGVEYPVAVVAGTKTGGYDGIQTRDCYIGNNFGDNYAFDGHISDVGVWNKVLTSAEIRAIYNASLTPGKSGPGASNVTTDSKFDYIQPPGFHKVHRNNLKKWEPVETITHGYWNYPLINHDAYDFGGSNNKSSLILTGSDNADMSNTIVPLVGAITSSGFAWTGWLNFGDVGASTYQSITSFGLRHTDKDFFELRKTYGSGKYKFEAWMRVQDTAGGYRTGGGAGTWNMWQFTSSDDWTSSWNHFAVTWAPHVNGDLSNVPSKNLKIYYNGVDTGAQRADSNTNRNFWSTWDATQSGAFGFSTTNNHLDINYNGAFSIGQNINGNRPLSGAIDEFTYWTRTLTKTEISSIYNGGTPCDITASTAYTADTAKLWDWIRFGTGSTNEKTNITTANNAAYSAGNRVVGFKGNKTYMPIALSGAANTAFKLTGTHGGHLSVLEGCAVSLTASTSTTSYNTSYIYDNFNVQHQIPRSTRQYRWISASIVDDNSNQFIGFTPASFKIPNLVNGTAGGSKNAYTFVSQSDYGSYYHAGKRKYGWTSASVMAGAVTRFLPVDFVGLNTIIVDSINTGSNTIGRDVTGRGPARRAVDSINYLNYSRLSTTGPSSNGGGFIQVLANLESSASILNSININRGGAYGYPMWKMSPGRHAMNPILQAERRANTLTMIPKFGESTGLNQLVRYRVPPVSMKGRPSLINITIADGSGQNEITTMVATNDNESIYFTNPNLDDQFQINYDDFETPFMMQLRSLTDGTVPGISTNWILYQQQLYPALINEFSSSRKRLNYDNKYWRTNRVARNKKSATGRNVLTRSTAAPFDYDFFENGYSASVNSLNQWVKESSWPLDAPDNFMTRATIPYITGNDIGLATIGALMARMQYKGRTGSAGELQNTYTNYFSGAAMAGYQVKFSGGAAFNWFSASQATRNIFAACGALYSRKHMMTMPRSVSPPNGVRIHQTGASWYTPVDDSNFSPGKYLRDPDGQTWTNSAWLTRSWFRTEQHPCGAGEALWEAGATAGKVKQQNEYGSSETPYGVLNTNFELSASEPWFDSYSDFTEILDLIGKDYAILPEYRMSEHVNTYVELQSFPETIELRVPGAYENVNEPLFGRIGSDMGTPNFYKDYSNTDFLGSDVQEIYQTTGQFPTEIALTASAMIRFNPYKGFYPVQRTMDIVKQFRQSYGSAIKSMVKYNSLGAPATPAWVIYEYDSEDLFTPSSAPTGGGNKIINSNTAFRPMAQALFAPGILFNSIKSGMAVDWPLVTEPNKVDAKYAATGAMPDWLPMEGRYGSVNPLSQNYAMGWSSDFAGVTLGTLGSGTRLKDFFGKRLPFETMLKPAKYLKNTKFYDMEANPSASLMHTTASFTNAKESIAYQKMAQNFFGQVADFFLEGSDYTSIKSDFTDKIFTFQEDSVYLARIKMRRSLTGPRNYLSESILSKFWYDKSRGTSYNDAGNPYTSIGGRAYNTFFTAVQQPAGPWNYYSGSDFVSGSEMSFEIPQDPMFDTSKENFTMYSRASAFGPDLIGRGSRSTVSNGLAYGQSRQKFPVDCFNGFNWAYTPPYYHGEAWCDLIFRPTGSIDYTLDKIMEETKTMYWRHDAGQMSASNPQALVSTSDTRLVSAYYPSDVGTGRMSNGTLTDQYARSPYGGNQINRTAMQISAAVNLFGIEETLFTEKQQFPPTTTVRSTGTSKRWIIKPKFETPMLNFNDSGVRPLTSSAAAGVGPWPADPTAAAPTYISIPTNLSSSVPRGMWHQFGVIEPDPEKGIFIEIGDIPDDWVRHHYYVLNTGSIYNNYSPTLVTNATNTSENGAIKTMPVFSLCDLVGFRGAEADGSSKKLGQLAQSKTIKEAMVAIPYRLSEEVDDPTSLTAFLNKEFIRIPNIMYEAAIKESVSVEGNTLETAGASIRNLLTQMDTFLLPPQIDFINNPDATPMVMYIFSFDYHLDQDDLSYIWQNIAPADYKKATKQNSSIAHYLMDQELLNQALISGVEDSETSSVNPLRWMVFKVKQRAKVSYDDLIPPQIDRSSSPLSAQVNPFNMEFSKRTVLERAKQVHAVRRRPEGRPDLVGDLILSNPSGMTVQPPTFTERFQYNWPYDYLSFVEAVKLDANIRYTSEGPPGTFPNPESMPDGADSVFTNITDTGPLLYGGPQEPSATMGIPTGTGIIVAGPAGIVASPSLGGATDGGGSYDPNDPETVGPGGTKDKIF